MDTERPPKWVFSGDAAARSYAAAYPCRLRSSHERDSTSGLRRRDADGCFPPRRLASARRSLDACALANTCLVRTPTAAASTDAC
ncbi:hypothetical protein SprV_1002838900 [Sparganum proliferum]